MKKGLSTIFFINFSTNHDLFNSLEFFERNFHMIIFPKIISRKARKTLTSPLHPDVKCQIHNVQKQYLGIEWQSGPNDAYILFSIFSDNKGTLSCWKSINFGTGVQTTYRSKRSLEKQLLLRPDGVASIHSTFFSVDWFFD